ncbi:MAG: hypothetical protein RI884_2031 [Pseudomonadota bacterium]
MPLRFAFILSRRVAACLLAGHVLIADAQPVPTGDPGSHEWLRQQERERQLRQQQRTVPDVRLGPGPQAIGGQRLPTDEAPCFIVTRIVLEGEAADEFSWALPAADHTDDGRRDPAHGRCLGRQAIALVMQRVQGAILARGFVTTRILTPAQDLSEGTLRLALLPGRIGAIHLQHDAQGRGTLWNAMPAATGQLLNLRDIEQALENFQRVPTVEADIQITPSEPAPGRPEVRPGESDLSIQWKQRLPFRLGLSVDDSGSRATGRIQGAVTFSYDNAFDLNDLFYLSIVQSLQALGDDVAAGPGGQGTRSRMAHYSIPFGRWLLAVHASSNRFFQRVVGATQDYVYSGESHTQDARLSRLVHRDATAKSHVFLRGWRRASNNFIDDTEVEVQRRRTAGWELGAQHRRQMGRASLDLGLAYRRGTGALQALSAPEDAFGEGASRPRILTADASFVLPLEWGAQRGRYGATAAAQWSPQALVPQDRFAIGGRHTVRGFDGESSLSAARGRWLRQELGWQLGASGQELFVGLDHGRVGGAGSDSLAGTRLTGAVLGWRGGYRQASWDLFAGRPLRKPGLFRTADRTAGFSFHLSF